MKLLYCIPSLYNPGGMERVISEKVNYLASLPNYAITIVTTDQQNKPICFQLDDCVNVIHLDINFSSHYSANLLKKYIYHRRKQRVYRHRLIELIEKQGIDICISLCGKEIEFLSKLPVSCKKLAEIHFSMNFRKLFLMAIHSGFVWKFLGDIRTEQLKNSVKDLDKLVVLTNADKLQWQLTHDNIIQIPNLNPLQNSNFSTTTEKRVITVGRLDAQKGFDMLLDVWAIVASKHPDWTLNIFGSGEWEQMLNDRIIQLNLSDVVSLRGLTKNVVENYLESSIYVMSSRYEGLPMVLIEAMSCGLPIVSFDCEHGPRELIEDGKTGFLVGMNKIDELADKICRLIEDDTLRLEMGNEARKSVSKYSKESIMKQWINLFEDVVK